LRANPGDQYTFRDTYTIEEARRTAASGAQTPVAISGRVRARRPSGGIAFHEVGDDTGAMQVVSDWDNTPDFDKLAGLNVGDYVHVRGTTGYSRRGVPSVLATDWALLAPTQVSFPNRRAGLADPELQARQRYLHLASSPAAMQRFKARSRIISSVRASMEEHGFLEVETPILQIEAGGAHARPFVTHHNALDTDLTLRIAPELFLKRLVVGGFKRVFEIGRVFRNEGMSTRHNPEFTMMEAYAAGWDFADHMQLTEELVSGLAVMLHGTTKLTYQGRELDVSTPWRRAPMDELVSQAVGQEVSANTDRDTLRQLCEKRRIAVAEHMGAGALLAELYGELVEGRLWQPTFVTDYPAEISPLARRHRSREGLTERFEGIVAGRELCNAYTELNDADEQLARFMEQAGQREQGNDEAMPIDRDYIQALRVGLPPTGGLGIGIDRLVMLLTDAASIRDVILFPTLRPERPQTPTAQEE